MSIYKYIPANRIDIIKDSLIRFTQSFDLNDPFEIQPHFTDKVKSETQIDNLIKNLSNFTEKILNQPNYAERTLKHFKVINKYNSILNRFFVFLSLTKNKNNILMWSHYSDNHKGLLIEFDDKHSFFNDNNKLLIKIPYSIKRPSYSYRETIDILNLIYNKLIKRKKFSRNERVVISNLFTKNISWSYEKEYRLATLPKYSNKTKSIRTKKEINNFNGQSHIFNSLDSRKFGKIESDYVHLYKMPPKCIKSIVFGCDCAYSLVKELFTIIKSNKKLSHIKLLRAELNDCKYILNYREISQNELLPMDEVLNKHKN